MELRELREEDHAKIRQRFDELKHQPGANVMRETGRLLSELTGTAAVVVSPKPETLTLKHLRFIRTVPGQLLAVLVMSNGAVQNRFLASGATEEELQRIHNVLDDVVEGRTLGDLRDLFQRRLSDERVQHDTTKRRAFELGRAVLGEATTSSGADVVIEGRAKLLGLPEFADATEMKKIVVALDEQERIVSLLEATLEARGTMVVVGHEAGELGGGQLSIVGAAYTDHGRGAGTVGVIGPTRMDYPKVLPLVTATANAMSAFIERGGRPERDPRGALDDDLDGDDS
jgi:heat-inducible transcriptional repressor